MESSNPFLNRLFALSLLMSLGVPTYAQAEGGNNLLIGSLIVIAAILLTWIIVKVSDNLLHIEGRHNNVDEAGISLIPKLGKLFQPKLNGLVEGSGYPVHILKKGFDILLEGAAPEAEIHDASGVTRYAMQPKNFYGMSPIPKVMVEIGDEVKAGQPLFYDKKHPEILYVSPVSGEYIALNRAEKRAVAEIVILADKEQRYAELDAPDSESGSVEEIREFLQKNGGWALIRQRPYQVTPASDDVPDNIFISTFDTSPMALGQDLVVRGNEAAFQKGLDVLGKLTEGKVYLGLDGRGDHTPSDAFVHATGVEKHWFAGKHPAGNVGIQIHHIHPVGPGRKAWTLSVQDVITMGNMWLEKRFNAERLVALNGTELKSPQIVRTRIGANIGELLAGNIKDGENRIISGNVLTGQKKLENQYLNIFDSQVSVIQEGFYHEPFGWMIPGKARPSLSKTYPSFLFPDNEYVADTNTHGERRAFVVTGEYEDVLPVDTYPQALMKAILNADFERMEGLGIHELVEEDVALCEFVCTSKMPVQKILREGLDLMRAQG